MSEQRKPPPRKMSDTCQITLSAVVRDLQGLRQSSSILKVPDALQPGIPKPESTFKKLPLLQMFAEEAKILRNTGVKLSAAVSILIDNLSLSQQGPLGRAAMLISQRAEEASDEPNYHNCQHILEVVVAAYILGRREKLPIFCVAELLIAAAAHDLGHTGERNRHDYERESHSVVIAKPILQQAGLPEANVQHVEKMILATDFRVGVPPARQAYLDTRLLPPTDERRLLASQCQLLTEADVLFSCFDLSYNEFLSKLLSAEWKKNQPNLSLDERIGFLSYVRFLSNAADQLGLEHRRLKLLKELTKAKEEQANGK